MCCNTRQAETEELVHAQGDDALGNAQLDHLINEVAHEIPTKLEWFQKALVQAEDLLRNILLSCWTQWKRKYDTIEYQDKGEEQQGGSSDAESRTTHTLSAASG